MRHAGQGGHGARCSKGPGYRRVTQANVSGDVLLTITHVHRHTYTHRYVHRYTDTYTDIHTYTDTHTPTHTHTHTSTQILITRLHTIYIFIYLT